MRLETPELIYRTEDLSKLLASTGIATLFIDCQMRILCFTPGVTPLIRLLPDDIGRPLNAVISKTEKYATLIEAIQAVLDTQQPRELELQIAPDTWYLVRIAFYRIQDNTITGTAVTFLDISERKQWEKYFSECDERLHAIIEQSTVGIAQVDAQGHFQFVNEQFCKALGYSRKELLQLRMQDITAPDDLPHNMILFRQLLNGGSDFKIEKRCLCKDGSVIWMRNSVNAIRDSAGQVQSLVAVSIDITPNKLAEEQLRHSQSRLQAIVSTATNGIITIDQRGTIISFNPAAETMFGYTEAELQGRNISELMPSPYNEQHDAILSAYLKAGDSQLIGKYRDVTGIRKDGSEFPMQLGVGEFCDGNERFFTGFVQDISDRKAAEMALRESGERLSFAMEASGEGVWDWDIANDQATHNQKWFELLGLNGDHESYTPMFFTTLLHEDDRQAVLDKIRQALAGDGHYRSEHRLRCADGKFIWVLEQGSVVKRNAQGRPLRMVGSFADITERKKAENALQESEARFRQITESLPQLIWTCRPDGACDYLSRQWTEFTGTPSAEQLGFNWLRLVHPSDKKHLLLQWRSTVANGTFLNVEYRVRRHDGIYCWFEGRAIPLRDESGKIRKWFGSSTDITERKLAEQQLREHQHHYERLLQLEVASQTAAAIAHELNQPLNAAASFTDAALRFLRSGNPDPEQLSEALAQCAQQIQRGGQVIHELCRFLRSQESAAEHFNLVGLITKLLHNLDQDGYFSKYTAVADFEENLPWVRGNEIQIEKVLSNLIHNGLEAMHEARLDRGSVHITVKHAEQKDFLQVTLYDSGPGFSNLASQKLFQPFFTTKPKGLGIGLALSRAMVEAQGGKLWAEPVSNSAIFHLTLPADNQSPP